MRVVAHTIAVESNGTIPANATVRLDQICTRTFRAIALVVRTPDFEVTQILVGVEPLVRGDELPIPSERWTEVGGPKLARVTAQPGMSIRVEVSNRSGRACAFEAELVGETLARDDADAKGELALVLGEIRRAEAELEGLRDRRARLEKEIAEHVAAAGTDEG